MTRAFTLLLLLALSACDSSDPKTAVAITEFDQLMASLPEKIKQSPGYTPARVDSVRREFVALAEAYPDSAINQVYKMKMGMQMMQKMGEGFGKK